jgi:hypothetical protein
MDMHAGLLRIATLLRWLGVLWNFGWWASAAWEFAREPRFSDAVSNALPDAFVGGLGFCVAWGIAWAIERFPKDEGPR